MNNKILIRDLNKEDYNDVLELEKQVHQIHYSNRPDLYNNVSELFPIDYFYSIIDNNYKRNGYAKMLFNELNNKLKTLNIDDIELTVWSSNKDAILFYESLGMTVKNIRYELKNKMKLNEGKIELNTSQSVK